MNDRFGDIAMGMGLISRSQLEGAYLLQRLCVDHAPIGRILYNLTYISQEDVREVLAFQRALREDPKLPAPRISREPVSKSPWGGALESVLSPQLMN